MADLATRHEHKLECGHKFIASYEAHLVYCGQCNVIREVATHGTYQIDPASGKRLTPTFFDN